jgi:LacI family transcriptional regulator
VLGTAGFSVILADTNNSVERERSAVQTLLQKQVDALVVASSSADGSHLREAVARGTTVVLVDAELPDLDVDSVTIDNVAAARMAVDHLLDLGHTDVAIVIGGAGPASNRARLHGYQQALADRGLDLPHEYICSGADTFEGGRAAAASMLEQWRRPSAVFATNNLMTVGTLVAIAAAGLKVPDDISVVGIDDMEWYPIANPAVTAVYESGSDMGRLAAERLLLRLHRKRQPPAERMRLQTEFRIRASTGPPLPATHRATADHG